MSPIDSSEFFECQSDITKAKLKLYEEYIKNYAPVLLMHFGYLLIADLFCGPWMNWPEKGSPLILIDLITELLQSPTIKNRKWGAKVIIILNDKDKNNIDEIQSILSTYPKSENIKFIIKNEEFEQILIIIENLLKNIKIPKFFFLDPFSFSIINLSNIKTVFNLDITEVLLFSPVMDMYRFVNAENIQQNPNHKTRKAIEDSTEEWILWHYGWIHEFCDAMVQKMKKELNENYIRYVLLDAWKRKHALFFLTHHRLWLLKFNRATAKLGDHCWIWVSISSLAEKENSIQSCFFTEKESKEFNSYIQERLSKFQEILINEIKQKPLTNIQVIELCAIYWILPEDIRDFLWNNTIFQIKLTWWKRMGTFMSDSNWDKEMCIFSIK